MTAPGSAPRSPVREWGRFLEIQNLGLNAPFAIAFLLVASGGWPSARTTLLVAVAFLAARNAGHSFNRWADRRYDAANPRTQDRALVTGRFSPGLALGFAGGSAALVVAAAFLLNPLALALAPVGLALVLGYSYTKRFTAFTTVVLGLVEGIVPAAVYVAVTGTLPWAATAAVGAAVAWGTAFETVHSLGDLEHDRRLGLRSLPLAIGPARALALVPVLQGLAIVLYGGFGYLTGLAWPYFAGLGAAAVGAAIVDRGLAVESGPLRRVFRGHFALAAIFLGGVVVALALPAL